MKYCSQLLELYDDCAGETWFSDEKYKTNLEDVMNCHNQAELQISLLKQVRKEVYMTPKEKKYYNELILGQIEEADERLDHMEVNAQAIKSGKFRYYCIFEEYRINGNEETLEKYNVTIDEIMNALGVVRTGEMMKETKGEDGTLYLINTTTNVVYDRTEYRKNNEYKEIGIYDPETRLIHLN